MSRTATTDSSRTRCGGGPGGRRLRVHGHNDNGCRGTTWIEGFQGLYNGKHGGNQRQNEHYKGKSLSVQFQSVAVRGPREKRKENAARDGEEGQQNLQECQVGI